MKLGGEVVTYAAAVLWSRIRIPGNILTYNINTNKK